ncbi:MAG: polysaccharide pyruvyl transferase family protein [Candidatus Bathyarchaeota archaeon]|nr:MAG: polysaccharide pyruvyl transferase family protein [Candidatus Bathyarchaeota archaeon]
MTRFLVFGGWFGSANLGDDAILIGLRRLLTKCIPGVEIVALSTDPVYTKRICGVEAIPLRSPKELLNPSKWWEVNAYKRIFSEVDACIMTGGTPIYDYGHLSRTIHLTLPKLLGKKLICFGIGAKPIHSTTGRLLIKNLLRQANAISTRDHPSKIVLKDLGLDKEIMVTGDSALFLEPEPASERILESSTVDIGTPVFAVCPRALSQDYKRHYHSPLSEDIIAQIRRSVARTADRLSETGLHVVFIPLHRVPPDDDLMEVARIRALMREPSKVVTSISTPGELMGVLGRMELVLGLRLHALILGAAHGIPVIGIDYDPKIRGFMELAGIPEYLCQLEIDSESLSERAMSALDEKQALKDRLTSSCQKIRSRIKREAARVASILG